MSNNSFISYLGSTKHMSRVVDSSNMPKKETVSYFSLFIYSCLLSLFACLMTFETVSLYSFDWPGNHYVDQAILELRDPLAFTS